MSKSVKFSDIATAGLWLAGVAHKTPVLTSKTVDQLVKSEVFFKCENFQRTGSFKFRGAYNALAQLSDAQKRQGVLTYSPLKSCPGDRFIWAATRHSYHRCDAR